MDGIRQLRRIFLPSRTVGAYVARVYATRFIAVLVGLVAVLQLLDMLKESELVLAAPGATAGSLVSYVFLRLPQLISQFVPFAALLATLLTLAGLNQHSEIIVMKSAGMSAHRILMPLGLVSLIIAVAHFIFHESVTVNASAELKYWAEQDYAVDLPPPPDVTKDVWVVENNDVIHVKTVSQSGSRVILDGVTIHERDEDGLLTSLVRAQFAWHLDDRWRLFDVRRFKLVDQSVDLKESEVWDISVGPNRFLALTIAPDEVSFGRLLNSIDQLKQEGLPVTAQLTGLYQKISGPAASLLMPLLGAIAGFGIARRGNVLVRVVTGMALGFTFFVADNFMVAMGQFGVAPPLLAAWAPFLLFLTVGFTLLFETEE